MPAGLLRRAAGIRACSGVAAQFAADGAGRAVEQARHRSDAVDLLLQTRQGHAVFGLELGVFAFWKYSPFLWK